ncbi:MAG TPA: SHOCT domain-containing protein [Actinomycetes bacterium]|nr:SHOCT domain-containing protein [Actinomycetes bacterium]
MRTANLLVAIQPYDRYHHMDGWHGGWMWLTGLVWLLVIVGLVGLVVWLVIRTNRPADVSGTGTDSARRILAERFARGEIDADEYARRRELLG